MIGRSYHNAVLPQFMTWRIPGGYRRYSLEVSEYLCSVYCHEAVSALIKPNIDQQTVQAVTNVVVIAFTHHALLSSESQLDQFF